MKKVKVFLLTLVVTLSIGISTSATEINKNDNAQLTTNPIDSKLLLSIEDKSLKSGIQVSDDLELSTKQIELINKIEHLSKIVEDTDSAEYTELSNAKKELLTELGDKLIPTKDNIVDTYLYDEPSIPNWTRLGDILVTTTGKTSDEYIGHAGICDVDEGYTIESWGLKLSPDKINGVAYRNFYDSYWKKQTKWGRFMVSGADGNAYVYANEYAQNQIGSPYNYTFTTIGNGYYCSELVAYAWKSAGFNVIGGSSNYNAILPSKLATSSNTYSVEGNL